MDSKTIIWCPDCQGEHPYLQCPLEGLCLFCKTRPATLHFGDLLSLTHGGQLNCCELCCAEMQLDHARERATEIPELEIRVEQARLGLNAPKSPKTARKRVDGKTRNPAMDKLAKKLRIMADKACADGFKDVADELHDIARRLEEKGIK